jgi:hypothetical protein
MSFIDYCFLTAISCCAGIVCFCLLMMWLEKQKDNSIPLNRLSIPKSTFIRLVLQWCHRNLRHSNTLSPTYEISYYKRKGRCGHYDSNAHNIVIYVNKHADVLSLTNTIIHEYIHARQGKKEIKRSYKYYTQKLGYWNNPYEIEARSVAEENQLRCLLELQQKFNIYQ